MKKLIRNLKLRDRDEEVIAQQKQVNIEQIALQEHKAKSLEEIGVQRSCLHRRPLSLDDQHYEPIDAAVEELRKGFIYAEILTPKHF